MSLMGLDLGTTGVRAVACTAAGDVLAEHSVRTPLSRAGDLVETDAEAVLVAVCDAVRNVIESSAVRADPVAAVSFSVQGEAVVPVDGDGRALAPAPVSMDRRGVGVTAAVGDVLGPAAFQQITGQPLHPMFSIFKIAAAHHGWTGADVAGYRTLDAFVAARLGATASTDYSMAARTGAFDVGRRTWSEPVLDAVEAAAGIRVAIDELPRVVAPGTVIGTVSAEAAQRSGLDAGTLIVAGLHDQAAGFVGAGGGRTGPSVFALGSSDCLTVLTGERPEGLGGTGFASYPIADDAWITLAGTAAGGWALEWFADLVHEPVTDLFLEFGDEPPSLIVLPYLVGSGTLDNDPGARGLIVGLTLETTRPQIARAFLEAAGYELAKIVAAFETRGIDVGPVRAVGSGAANLSALQVRAAAAGRDLQPVIGQASARGAALLAGMGTGLFGSIDQIPDLTPGAAARPGPRHHDWYRQQRASYDELYAATASTVHLLSHQQGEHP